VADQESQAKSVAYAAWGSGLKGRAALLPIHALVHTDCTPETKPPMDDSCAPQPAPPVADLTSLHRELEQLFARTRQRSQEASETAVNPAAGPCLVIRGK